MPLTGPELRILRQLSDEWQPAVLDATGRGRQLLATLVSQGFAEKRDGLPFLYRLSDAGRARLAEEETP